MMRRGYHLHATLLRVMVLSIRDLRREPWLRGFELDVEAGEVVVLRGPSGAGKSLLLRCVADLEPRDGGRILWGTSSQEDVSPMEWRKRVRLVPQTAPPWSGTVADALELWDELDPCPGGERHVSSLARDAPVARLSGGERQVLALEAALAGAAEVLLLDEPTSAMDPELAAAWEVRLEAAAKAGRAILWVAHDATLAARLGCREVHL